MPTFPPDFNLSGLNGSDGFRLSGESAGNHTGFSVSSAGDVNGDGFTDVIVGAPNAEPNGARSGVSYVVFGKAAGFAANLDLSTLDGTNGFRLEGVAAYDLGGTSVSAAGDVNGDGLADLIVGAPGDGVSGASYVVFGKAAGFTATLNLSTLDGTTGFRLSGAAGFGASGDAVAGAGDVNGDGFDDVIVGAYLADGGDAASGASYVVFGKAAGTFAAQISFAALDGSNGFRLNGAVALDYAGCSVATAGDINGDGFADVIVGARKADANGDLSGASYVVFGKAAGFAADLNLSALDGQDGFRLSGAAAADKSGVSVSTAGDVNGDGFADLLVGANYADVNGNDAGAAYLVFGKAEGFAPDLNLSALDGSNGFRLTGASAQSNAGIAVGAAGDVNGDGFADIIVGAYFATAAGVPASGASYVVFGKAAGFAADLNLAALDGSNGFRLNGAASLDRAGCSVAGAGDVNGDGFADVIVGAWQADPNGDSSGASYVVFGLAPTEAVTRTGSAIAQTVRGGAFNDTLFGLGGDDQLFGDGGADSLDGGTDADLMVGGDGSDTYVVDDIGDIVTETTADSSTGGVDIVRSGIATYTLGTNVENGVLTRVSGGSLIGNTLANALTGGAGADTLSSGDGDDSLDGGLGADTLMGGDGADTYVVDDAGDTVSETNPDRSTGGVDTVRAGVASYALTANVENGVITLGSGASLTGNSLDNTLLGSAGNDTLNGGTGADRMLGGQGDDIYLVDDSGDEVMEDDAGGIDTVRFSSALYALGSFIENGTILSAGGASLTGNALANSLTGGAGNDQLDGGLGADTMAGGDGDDTYVVDELGDAITETSGLDAVESSITYTLGAGLEHLTLTGSGNLNGTGNASVNAITGNAGNNRLDGGAGADTLIGDAGDDTYVVDDLGDSITESSGLDTVEASITHTLDAGLENLTLTGSGNANGTGNASVNVLTGNTGNNYLAGDAGGDTLVGGAGNDTLDGGTGSDQLVGGLGDDIYIVDDSGDEVMEDDAGGVDTVRFSSSLYALGSFIENGVILSIDGASLSGNALANSLTGAAGDDSLDGGLGADTMAGGAGADTYVVDDALDVVTELAGGGIDSVLVGAATYTLAEEVENGSVTRTLGATMDGNGLANSLIGNTGNDTLFGAAGVDTLFGNDGADTLDGGLGADILLGGAGGDVYVVNEAGDLVTETDADSATGGVDTVLSQISAYTLGDFIENGRILSDVAASLTGNDLNNTLTGSIGNDTLSGAAGADRLFGGTGADSLNGGAGADRMEGGNGSDVYIFDNAGDAIVEASSSLTTGGNDLVLSALTYTLGNNLEKLTLTGTSAINGTGNTLNNLLTGNSFANILKGMTGLDSLAGGAGNDQLFGGLGNDTLTGGTGADRFVFDSALGSSNIDRITDFARNSDKLVLDDDIFGKLGVGNATGKGISSGNFKVGTAAGDSNDYLIYNSSTDKLFYDVDGNGARAAVQIATVTLAGTAAPTYKDFLLVV